jgi:hypothetical protein
MTASEIGRKKVLHSVHEHAMLRDLAEDIIV